MYIRNLRYSDFISRPSIITFVVLLVTLILSFIYFINLSNVPFHPDEGTQIYMSHDFTALFQAPSSLFWNSENEDSDRQRYRELDAPITRYLIGMGRIVTATPELIRDWNWSLSYTENFQSGSMPSSNQLLVSRFSVAFFFPLSLILIFAIGKNLSGFGTGLLSMLLIFINSLILLHTRRAMAESAMIFFILLFFWVAINYPKNIFLLAISFGLAFNSKYSTIFLLPIVVFLIFFSSASSKLWIHRIFEFLLFGLLFIAITFVLNPFLWSEPIQAAFAALNARRELLLLQTNAISAVSPGHVLGDFYSRLGSLIGNLFFNPPAVEDISNYHFDFQIEIQNYINNQTHSLLRGLIGGGLMLFLFLFGLFSNFYLAVKNNKEQSDIKIILIIAFFGGLVFYLVTVPLAFQRYVLILIPVVLLFIADSIVRIIYIIKNSLLIKPV